ncbi:MAG: YeeE/YedE thiosulfate transporter family protein [Gemmatimonadota bacterium]
MTEILSRPWPWYIAGPVIGLIIPVLLVIGNKPFGISSSLRHICAACVPGQIDFFRYDWKKERWSLVLSAGIVLGGVLGGVVFRNPNPVRISPAAEQQLQAMGVTNQGGMHPIEIFNFHSLLTAKGFLLIVVGGFLVGFGTRYAGGCTSGHSIMGLANLQWPSLVATCCFFAGGLVMTWMILPRILAL